MYYFKSSRPFPSISPPLPTLDSVGGIRCAHTYFESDRHRAASIVSFQASSGSMGAVRGRVALQPARPSRWCAPRPRRLPSPPPTSRPSSQHFATPGSCVMGILPMRGATLATAALLRTSAPSGERRTSTDCHTKPHSSPCAASAPLPPAAMYNPQTGSTGGSALASGRLDGSLTVRPPAPHPRAPP